MTAEDLQSNLLSTSFTMNPNTPNIKVIPSVSDAVLASLKKSSASSPAVRHTSSIDWGEKKLMEDEDDVEEEGDNKEMNPDDLDG